MEKNNNLIILSASQKTSLSYSLQYSLKILEMNNLQLRDYIQNSLLENPFLKEDEIEDYRDDSLYANSSKFIENLADKKSFKDELLSQICFFRFCDDKKEIAELLIEHVIDNKYLNNEILQNISKEKSINYFEVLTIIKQLQLLSPNGLFSFNIKDKIKSSLEASGKYDENSKIFIQNLDFILDKGFSELKKKCGFNDIEIGKIKSDIKNLKINFSFYSDFDDSSYIIPDLIIERKAKDGYESSVNTDLLPQLSIDDSLYENVMNYNCSQNDIEYMKEKIDSAKLLIKSINYRNSTLLKIAKEIAYRQYKFFARYVSDINPVSVKTIANTLMLHEGTVHRAIADKSVSTPRGIFEIKKLMPSEIKSKIINRPVSNHSVKEHIKNLIKQEPKNKPYSDEYIMRVLNSKGIIISRRTIAKYRDILDIPKVSQRVKFYKITNLSA